jgi:hypothetical protein
MMMQSSNVCGHASTSCSGSSDNARHPAVPGRCRAHTIGQAIARSSICPSRSPRQSPMFCLPELGNSHSTVLIARNYTTNSRSRIPALQVPERAAHRQLLRYRYDPAAMGLSFPLLQSEQVRIASEWPPGAPRTLGRGSSIFFSTATPWESPCMA